MKKLFILAAPWLFILFTACGGGDQQGQPPPPATSPAGNQTLQDIGAQVQRANTSCSQGLTPAILLALTAKQQGAPDPSLLGILGQANTGDCQNLLMNILLQAKTVDNGNWINNTPGAKAWLAAQTMGIINRVGANVQAQGGNLQMAQSLPWKPYINQTFLPGMGADPALKSQVNSAF